MYRPLLPLVLLALALSTSGVVARTQSQGAPSSLSAVGPGQGACFTATLLGAAEAPPNSSPATGTGTFVLSADQSSLVYDIRYSGLSSAETAAHFHRGAPGVPGPVVYPLPATNPKQGAQALTPADVTDIQAGLWYVNIHTTSFPGGEIRGQLVPSSDCYAAILTGLTEVPVNASPATGTGVFALAPDGSALVYDIRYSGLSSAESAAHFHRATPGVGGPVVYPLPATNPKQGTQALTGQDLSDLRNGLLYVNIHTANFSGGEIRGQIFPATNCFTAVLSGAAETPANASPATGVAALVLSPDETTLTFSISYDGLTSMEMAAHFHRATVGVAGPIVYPLPATNPKQDSQALTAQDVADLRAGLLYINIHTMDFAGGEIRGQVFPTNRGCFSADLSGAAETPPNSSPATGTGIATLAPDGSTLVYDISYSGLTATETAAHFHRGAPGVPGPVVYPLPATNPKRGSQDLTDRDVADLHAGRWYINIHTGDFPGGEIRGQLLPDWFGTYLPLVVTPEATTAGAHTH